MLGLGAIKIRQTKDGSFLHFLFSVVKYHKTRLRNCYRKFSIQKHVFCQHRVKICHIQQIAKRHVWIFRRLVFIQKQPVTDHKRDIVFHAKINGVFQGRDDQLFRILICGVIHCIIKCQKRPLFLKDHTKDPVFVGAYRNRVFQSFLGLIKCSGQCVFCHRYLLPYAGIPL